MRQGDDSIDTATLICGLEVTRFMRILCVILIVINGITTGLPGTRTLKSPIFNNWNFWFAALATSTLQNGATPAGIIVPFVSVTVSLAIYCIGLCTTCAGGARAAYAFRVLVLFDLAQQLALDILSLAVEVVHVYFNNVLDVFASGSMFRSLQSNPR